MLMKLAGALVPLKQTDDLAKTGKESQGFILQELEWTGRRSLISGLLQVISNRTTRHFPTMTVPPPPCLLATHQAYLDGNFGSP